MQANMKIENFGNALYRALRTRESLQALHRISWFGNLSKTKVAETQQILFPALTDLIVRKKHLLFQAG